MGRVAVVSTEAERNPSPHRDEIVPEDGVGIPSDENGRWCYSKSISRYSVIIGQ